MESPAERMPALLRRQGAGYRLGVTRIALSACVLAVLGGCPVEAWTGRSPLPRAVDGLPFSYREHEAPGGARDRVAYVIHHGANADVVHLSIFPSVSEWARDDGRGADKNGGDGDFTGVYSVAAHRRNPAWAAGLRLPPLGEQQRPLHPSVEDTHPTAHRRAMAGGPGGAFDNAAVCPPGYVLVGMRYRKDSDKRTIAQLAPACRPFVAGPPPARHDTPVVEGSNWGEDNRTPMLTVECPPGHAAVAQGAATVGPWLAYTVITAVKMSCARMDDPSRRAATEVMAGFPTEPWLPMRCDLPEGYAPAPFAAGLRIIAGQRLDAVGFLCDVPPAESGPPPEMLSFPVTPTSTFSLRVPLLPRDGEDVIVSATTVGRSVENATAGPVLPVGDATVKFQLPMGRDVVVVSPVEGCVVTAAPSLVVLAMSHGPASCPVTEPPGWIELRGIESTTTVGSAVHAGDTLGAPAPDRVVLMRAVSSAVVREPLPTGLPPSPLSAVTGRGSSFTARAPAPPPPPTASKPEDAGTPGVDGGP